MQRLQTVNFPIDVRYTIIYGCNRDIAELSLLLPYLVAIRTESQQMVRQWSADAYSLHLLICYIRSALYSIVCVFWSALGHSLHSVVCF